MWTRPPRLRRWSTARRGSRRERTSPEPGKRTEARTKWTTHLVGIAIGICNVPAALATPMPAPPPSSPPPLSTRHHLRSPLAPCAWGLGLAWCLCVVARCPLMWPPLSSLSSLLARLECFHPFPSFPPLPPLAFSFLFREHTTRFNFHPRDWPMRSALRRPRHLLPAVRPGCA